MVKIIETTMWTVPPVLPHAKSAVVQFPASSTSTPRIVRYVAAISLRYHLTNHYRYTFRGL
jgi:hypothetical protein